jgi:hypothetical protein
VEQQIEGKAAELGMEHKAFYDPEDDQGRSAPGAHCIYHR